MEEIINKLINSNLKLVSRETGIPYDRMFKWKSGKGKPKKDDYDTLVRYFENGIKSIEVNQHLGLDNNHKVEYLEKEISSLEAIIEDLRKDKAMLINDKLTLQAEKEELKFRLDLLEGKSSKTGSS